MKIANHNLRFARLTSLLWLLASTGLTAATHNVTIQDFSFQPASLSIQPGDTVRWTNQDGTAHTSTSDTGLWNSGLLGTGGSFERTFASAGTFSYHCSPHPFMQGTIAVQEPVNQPPSVTLTAPANNTVLNAPGTVTLSATATDNDGTVVRVEFYAGSTLLGVAVKAPFSITVTLNSGPNSVTARAYDNAGGIGDSSPALVTVNSPTNVALDAITPAGGDMSVSFLNGGGPWVLQRTDDVVCGVWINDKITATRTVTTAGGDPARFVRVADLAERDTILFSAVLQGASERPDPVTTTATGSALFRLKGNHLIFNITYSGLSGTATAAHIHGPAAASESTGVLINLQPYNGGAFGSSGSLSGEVILTAAQKEHLLSGRTYVNIHTTANTGGEIRGQIMPAAFQARLAGTYERPNRVTTPADGYGAFVLVGNELSFNIYYEGLSGTASAAHIHGPAGVDTAAGVLINLDPFKGGGFGTHGTFAGTVTLQPDQLAAVVDGLTYVNIHTAANPPGEIRGQILPHLTATPFTAVLSGDAEKPTPVTTDATGSGMFMLEGHVLNFSLRYRGLSGAATMAHIHGEADSTTSAGVLINLEPYVIGGFDEAGTIAGSILLTAPQRASVLAGRTYVNIHTVANGPGEIRGQISPVAYGSRLNGFNERPTMVTTPGSGFATAALVGRALHFNLKYQDLGTAATMAHIHGRADSQATAGILVDLGPFALGGFATSGSLVGKATLNTSTAGSVVDGRTYFNIHTTGHSGGEIRGQITP
jgi:plastocyanin